MKLVINRYCLFVILIFAFFSVFSTPAFAQFKPLPTIDTMHITVNLSDKVSYHFEKYILYAYNQLGYKVIFEKILTARAREMVDAGRLDAMMIAEKEIEQVYSNLLRVPVMLAKGSLMLYCHKQIDCQVSALENENNIVGVVSGHSMSAFYMREMRASTYAVKGQENLGVMLTKGRLNYVLVVHEDRLGNIGNFDDTQYQKVEVYRSEGYHFIHKKHKHLLPQLTISLQLAIEKYGPLVKPEKEEKANNG